MRLSSSLDPAIGVDLGAWLAGTGRWKLVRGEALALLSQLPDACVDAVVTDGPYSSGGMFRGDRAAKTGDKYIRTEARQAALAADVRPDLAKAGALVGYWTDWRQLPATSDALQAGGWTWRGIWTWDKTEGVRPMLGRPRAQCEFVVWGSKGGMPPGRAGGIVEPGVVRMASTTETKGGHQTGKPVEVCRPWARLTEPAGVILDPFSGGASQGLAALDEGRRYLGFEVVPRIHADASAKLAAREGAVLAGRGGQGNLFAEAPVAP